MGTGVTTKARELDVPDLQPEPEARPAVEGLALVLGASGPESVALTAEVIAAYLHAKNRARDRRKITEARTRAAKRGWRFRKARPQPVDSRGAPARYRL